MKKTITIALTLITLAINAQETLTLEKAVSLTLEKNYNIKISENNEQVAKNNTGILNSGYLPNISTNAYGKYDIKNVYALLNNDFEAKLDDINTVNYNANIKLDYLVFNGFGRMYSAKMFKEQHNLSKLQTKFVIENAVSKVMTQYYTISQQYESIENAKKSLAISKKRKTRTQYGFDYGQNSKLDILNAQVDYNNDSITILNLELQLANAKRTMNELMGVNIDYDFVTETDLTFDATLNEEDLLRNSLENNTGLQQAEKNILIDKFAVKAAKTGWAPKVNLTGMYYFNNLNNDSDGGFGSTVAINYSNTHGPLAQISLSWNFFDGGKYINRIQNAKIQTENIAQQYDASKLTVEKNLKNTWYSYKNALEIIKIQEQNLATNQENFKRTEEKFKVGHLNSIFYRQAQLNLLNAENQLNIAKFNAKIMELNLLLLSGGLVE